MSDKLQVPHSVLADLAGEFTSGALQARPEPVSTGWTELDGKLGGLGPGLYVLGAVSSLGKSTFSLQMAENIARRDRRPVLYFSLEMSSQAIAAKSIARRVFAASGGAARDVQSRELLRRQDAGRAGMLEALTEQARLDMGELDTLHIYTPGETGVPLTADCIVEIAKGFPDDPWPVVIVDYLQIIPAPPDDRDYRDSRIAIDRNIQKLRALANSGQARGKGMAVLVISSLNRDAYYEPIGMSAFKESGGIEYSADVLMGMEFSEIHQKRPGRKDGLQWLTRQKQQCPRLIDISILKQRYGESNVRVPFRYYPPWDCFQQAADVPYDIGAEDSVAAEAAPEKPGKPEQSGRVLRMNNSLLAKALRFWQALPGKYYRKGTGEIIISPFPDNRKLYDIQTKLSQPEFVCSKDERGELILPDYAQLTYWDMMVADAVFTLYQEAELRAGRFADVNYTFKTNDILRLLSGDPLKPNKIRLDKGKGVYRAIQASIEKMEKIVIRIDAKDEMHHRYRQWREDEIPAEFSGPFLQLWKEERDLPGDVPDWTYSFFSSRSGKYLHMPLYTYVMYTNQVMPVALERLATPADSGKPAFSDTIKTLTLKHYVARSTSIALGTTTPGMNKIHLNTDEGLFSILGYAKDDGSRKTVQKKNEAYDMVTKLITHYRRLSLLTARQTSPASWPNSLPLALNPWARRDPS